MIKSLFNLQQDRFGVKTIIHALMGVVIMITGGALSSSLVIFFRHLTGLDIPALTIVMRAMLSIGIIFILVYLYIVKGLKMPLSDFRICKPKSIAIWILVALALPAAVACFFIFLTSGNFEMSNIEPEQIIQKILTALLILCLTAGIVEELIFRGFIMRLLEIRWQKYIAIIVPSIMFGILHIFNMEKFNAIDVLLVLVAGTAIGAMFSLVAYQSGSIWAGATIHGLWNLIISSDILEISVAPQSPIFAYTLNTNSTLLTGGAFGIESSLPAIIAYGIVTLVALLLFRPSAKNTPDSTPALPHGV